MAEDKTTINQSTRFRGHFILDKSREYPGGNEDHSLLETSIRCSEICANPKGKVEPALSDKKSRYRIRLEYEFDPSVRKSKKFSLSSVELLSASEGITSSNILTELKPILRTIVDQLVENHHSESMEVRKSDHCWPTFIAKRSDRDRSSLIQSGELIKVCDNQTEKLKRKVVRKSASRNSSLTNASPSPIYSPAVDEGQIIPISLQTHPAKVYSFVSYNNEGYTSVEWSNFIQEAHAQQVGKECSDKEPTNILMHIQRDNDTFGTTVPEIVQLPKVRLSPREFGRLLPFSDFEETNWLCLHGRTALCPQELCSIVHVFDGITWIPVCRNQLNTFSANKIRLFTEPLTPDSDNLYYYQFEGNVIGNDAMSQVSENIESKTIAGSHMRELSALVSRSCSERQKNASGRNSRAFPNEAALASTVSTYWSGLDARSLDRGNRPRYGRGFSRLHKSTSCQPSETGGITYQKSAGEIQKPPFERLRSRRLRKPKMDRKIVDSMRIASSQGIKVIPTVRSQSFDKFIVVYPGHDFSLSNTLEWNNNSTDRKVQTVLYCPVLRPIYYRRGFSTPSMGAREIRGTQRRRNHCYCLCRRCSRNRLLPLELSQSVPVTYCRRVRRRRRRRCGTSLPSKVYLDLEPGHYSLHRYSSIDPIDTCPSPSSVPSQTTARKAGTNEGPSNPSGRSTPLGSTDTKNNSSASNKHHCKCYTFLDFSRAPGAAFHLIPACITDDTHLIQKNDAFSNAEVWRRKRVNASKHHSVKPICLRSGLIPVELPLLLPSRPFKTNAKMPRRVMERRTHHLSRQVNTRKKRCGLIRHHLRRVRPKSYVGTIMSQPRLLRSPPSSIWSEGTQSSYIPVGVFSESSRLFPNRTKSEQMQTEVLPNCSAFNLAPCSSPSRKCLAEEGKFYFFASSPDSLTTVRSEFVEPKVQMSAARLRTDGCEKQYSAVCPVVIGDTPSRNSLNKEKISVHCGENDSNHLLDMNQPDISDYYIYDKREKHLIPPGLNNVAECIIRSTTGSTSQQEKDFTNLSTEPMTNLITNIPVTTAKMPWKSYPLTVRGKSPVPACYSSAESIRPVDGTGLLAKTPSVLAQTVANVTSKLREQRTVEKLKSVWNVSVDPHNVCSLAMQNAATSNILIPLPYSVQQPLGMQISQPTQLDTDNRFANCCETMFRVDQIRSRMSVSQCDKSFSMSDCAVAMNKSPSENDLLSNLRKSSTINIEKLEEPLIVEERFNVRKPIVCSQETQIPCSLEVCTCNSPVISQNTEKDTPSSVDEISESLDYTVFTRAMPPKKNSLFHQDRRDVSASVTELSSPTDYRFNIWSSLSTASTVASQFQLQKKTRLDPISTTNIAESNPSTKCLCSCELRKLYTNGDANEAIVFRDSSTAVCAPEVPLGVTVVKHSSRDSEFLRPVVLKDTLEQVKNTDRAQCSICVVGDVSQDSECPSEEPSMELDVQAKPCSDTLDFCFDPYRDSHGLVNWDENSEANAEFRLAGKTGYTTDNMRGIQSVSPKFPVALVGNHFNHLQEEESRGIASPKIRTNKRMQPWKRYNFFYYPRRSASQALIIYHRHKRHMRFRRNCTPPRNFWRTKLTQASPLPVVTLARRVLALSSNRNRPNGGRESRRMMDTNNSNSCLLSDDESLAKNRLFPLHLSMIETPCALGTECAPQLEVSSSLSSISVASKSALTVGHFVKLFLVSPHKDNCGIGNLDADNGDSEFPGSNFRRVSGTRVQIYALTGHKFIAPEYYFTTEDMSMDVGDLESNNWAEFDESSCSVRLDGPDLLRTDSSASSDGRVNCNSAPGYFWYLNEADNESWIPFRELSDEGRGDDLLGELNILDFNYINQISISQSGFLSFDGATDYSEADSFISSQLALSALHSHSESRFSQNKAMDKTLNMQSPLFHQTDLNPVLDNNELNFTYPKPLTPFSDTIQYTDDDECRTIIGKTVESENSVRRVWNGITRSPDYMQAFPDLKSDASAHETVKDVPKSCLLFTNVNTELESVRLVLIQTSGSYNNACKGDPHCLVSESHQTTHTVEQLVRATQPISSFNPTESRRTLGLIPVTNYILLERREETNGFCGYMASWKTQTIKYKQATQFHPKLRDQMPVSITHVQFRSPEMTCNEHQKSDITSVTVERQLETVSVSSPLWTLAKRSSEPLKRSGLSLSTRSFSNTFKSAWIRFKSPYQTPESVCHSERMSLDRNIDCLPVVRRKRIFESPGPAHWSGSQLKAFTVTTHRVHRSRGARRTLTPGHRTDSQKRIQFHEFGSISHMNPVYRRTIGRPSSVSLNRRIAQSCIYGPVFKSTAEQIRNAQYIFSKPRSTYVKQTCRRRTKVTRDKPVTAFKKVKRHIDRTSLSELSFLKEHITKGLQYHDSLSGELDEIIQSKRGGDTQFRSLRHKPIDVSCQTVSAHYICCYAAEIVLILYSEKRLNVNMLQLVQF
ncbi:hypothetical protein FBUS_05333 [Fasciolopsis buskii]|uniref:Uncharacterized protein n=1 Tax=Fasciolopsis buskii TaxID=27845 RepID=A0A8E0RWU3_9TREM|nr:hypothetical protein FBUS_05333 [Fasciolopsis buski]